MSSAWIWTTWTALLIALAYITVVYDLGIYEFPMFLLGGLVISIATVWYDRSTHAAEHHP
jgi:hypothetical protein